MQRARWGGLSNGALVQKQKPSRALSLLIVCCRATFSHSTHLKPGVQAGKGGFFGRGAYFVDNAAYVNGSFSFHVPSDEPHRTRQLLLVHVLCGTTHDVGRVVNCSTQTLVKPPRGFHSVSGGPHRAGSCAATTAIWAVYDRAQAYPAYIVTYRV